MRVVEVVLNGEYTDPSFKTVFDGTNSKVTLPEVISNDTNQEWFSEYVKRHIEDLRKKSGLDFVRIDLTAKWESENPETITTAEEVFSVFSDSTN